MANTFGNQHSGNTSPPSAGNTEFERSISRSIESQQETPSGLRETISEDLDAAKKAAQNATETVTAKATEVAERQKDYVADQISSLASALEKVGTEMQREQPGAFGAYARQLGTSAKHFAERVQDKDLGQIASEAESFGRRQPLAFLGIAAIAGLAASRFLMASANRSAGTTSADTSVSNGAAAYSGSKETYNG